MNEKVIEELQKFRDKHANEVSVSCDEYHSHSAMRGCIDGPEESIMICKMWEYASILKAKLEQISDISKLE